MLALKDMRAIVGEIAFDGWRFMVRKDRSRPYLQVSACGRCNVTGGALDWTGRKWFLSPHMTRSEVVQTAFKAVMTAVEHETRERFAWRGRAIFGPHFDIDQLHALCGRADALDEREAKR